MPDAPSTALSALQADKLKTFAALNRTQQSAKKSSEFGAGPPSGNGYVNGSPGSGPRPGTNSGAAVVSRQLIKAPSLHKAREVSTVAERLHICKHANTAVIVCPRVTLFMC